MPKDPIGPHLARFPDEQRAALERVRATVRSALPLGEECLAWGMPSIRIDGVAVLGYEGFRRHNSLFPMSGTVIERLAAELAAYDVTKGTIHFPVDTPFPAGLLRRIISLRIADINASYPKKSGEFKSFHANGALRTLGRMRNGERVGEWTTYDRAGGVVKVTRHS